MSGSLVSVALVVIGLLLLFSNPARWWYTATVGGALFVISIMRLTCEAAGLRLGLPSCRTWAIFQLGAAQLTGLLLFAVPVIPEGEFIQVLVCTTLMLMLWVIHLGAQPVAAWAFVTVLVVVVSVAWAYWIITMCVGDDVNNRGAAAEYRGGARPRATTANKNNPRRGPR